MSLLNAEMSFIEKLFWKVIDVVLALDWGMLGGIGCAVGEFACTVVWLIMSPILWATGQPSMDYTPGDLLKIYVKVLAKKIKCIFSWA
mgnify:CR=1 FL=1